MADTYGLSNAVDSFIGARNAVIDRKKQDEIDAENARIRDLKLQQAEFSLSRAPVIAKQQDQKFQSDIETAKLNREVAKTNVDIAKQKAAERKASAPQRKREEELKIDAAELADKNAKLDRSQKIQELVAHSLAAHDIYHARQFYDQGAEEQGLPPSKDFKYDSTTGTAIIIDTKGNKHPIDLAPFTRNAKLKADELIDVHGNVVTRKSLQTEYNGRYMIKDDLGNKILKPGSPTFEQFVDARRRPSRREFIQRGIDDPQDSRNAQQLGALWEWRYNGGPYPTELVKNTGPGHNAMGQPVGPVGFQNGPNPEALNQIPAGQFADHTKDKPTTTSDLGLTEASVPSPKPTLTLQQRAAQAKTDEQSAVIKRQTLFAKQVKERALKQQARTAAENKKAKQIRTVATAKKTVTKLRALSNSHTLTKQQAQKAIKQLNSLPFNDLPKNTQDLMVQLLVKFQSAAK